MDDMLITGGENVYPREIEDVLYEMNGVAEAAVFGTPDDRFGELVTAVILPNGDLTEEDITDFCRERLAGYKIPRRVEFVDEVPRTSTRKVDKVALREQFD